MYECFELISQRVDYHLDLDVCMMATCHRHQIELTQHKPAVIPHLVVLFRAVHGRSDADSFKILSGNSAGLTLEYAPMTLDAAREAIALCEAGSSTAGSSTPRHLKCTTALFVIDEVPAKNDTLQYERCILLRNLIRCMQGVCLLSGTEAVAMNAIDDISASSRGDKMRLFVRLPPLLWSIYKSDPKYTDLIASLAPDAIAMHSCSTYSTRCWRSRKQRLLPAPLRHRQVLQVRHLFVASTVQYCPQQRSVVLQNKQNYISDGGLYAQLELLHAKFIEHTVDELLASTAVLDAVTTGPAKASARAVKLHRTAGKKSSCRCWSALRENAGRQHQHRPQQFGTFPVCGSWQKIISKGRQNWETNAGIPPQRDLCATR